VTSHDHPLDVDLEVLTATEQCRGDVYCSSGHEPDELCTHCNGSGRVPSKLWLPWTPTTCPTCEGSGWDHTHENECDPRCDGSHERPDGLALCPRGPDMCERCDGSGLVVPQVGDVINWTVEEWRARLTHPAARPKEVDWGSWHTEPMSDIERNTAFAWPSVTMHESRIRSVARSTVHQTAPIMGQEDELTEAWAMHFAAANDGPLWLWHGPDIELGENLSTGQYQWKRTDMRHLLDGPWAELWVPGNWAIELTTEVLDD
jgi:hypothetical protein